MDVNELKNKDSIHYIIERIYEIKKGYITKWFTTQEIQEENLLQEEKLIFSNGIIIQGEEIKTLSKKRIINTYKNGGIVESIEYNDKGEQTHITSYHRNNYGDIIESRYSFKILREWSRYHIKKNEYIYDEIGRIYQIKRYDEENKIIEFQTKIYNNKGDIQNIIHNKGMINEEIDEYIYDEYGDTIVLKWWNKGVQVISKYEYTYDEFKNCTELKQYRDDVFNLLHTKQYDKFQNWTELRCYRNGVFNLLYTREFKYK